MFTVMSLGKNRLAPYDDFAVEVLHDNGDVEIAAIATRNESVAFGTHRNRDETKARVNYFYRPDAKWEDFEDGLKVRRVPDPRPILELEKQIEQKKGSKQDYLERLEAEIKEMDDRLKRMVHEWNSMK